MNDSVSAEKKELNIIFLSASSQGLATKGNWPYSVSLGKLCKQLEAKGNHLILASKIKCYVPPLGMLACSSYDLIQRESSNIIIGMSTSSL